MYLKRFIDERNDKGWLKKKEMIKDEISHIQIKWDDKEQGKYYLNLYKLSLIFAMRKKSFLRYLFSDFFWWRVFGFVLFCFVLF
jgi:hypothetical protein